MAARRALPADFTGLSGPPGERLLDEKGNSNGKEECTRRAVCPRGVITLISNMCQESDSSRQAGGGGGGGGKSKKKKQKKQRNWGLCSCGTESKGATDPHSSLSALIRGMMGKTHGSAGRGDLIKVAKRLESVRRPPSGESRHYLFLVFSLTLSSWPTVVRAMKYGHAVIRSSCPPPPTHPFSLLRSLSPYTSPGFHHCLASLQQRAAREADNSFCSVSPH